MLADMQEAGVPVTFGYIADVHERKDCFQCTTADATGSATHWPWRLRYEENLQRYDQAFAKFLDRLAKDGIGPGHALRDRREENDHLPARTSAGPTPCGSGP
jgi:hypothetical protein